MLLVVLFNLHLKYIFFKSFSISHSRAASNLAFLLQLLSHFLISISIVIIIFEDKRQVKMTACNLHMSDQPS